MTGPAGPARARRRRTRRTDDRRLAWLLCTPAVLVMLAVTAVPAGYALWLSLQRYDLRFSDQREFVGLANYAAVLSAPTFWSAVAATAVVTAVAVTAEMALGFAVAVVLHRAVVGRRAVRTAVLLPYGITTVVAAYAWQYAATPDLSFVSDRAWLAERWSSFAVVIATEVWKSTPVVALLLLAGLAAVPDELLETARVDGAGAWQRLWGVVLPAMRPVLVVVLLYRILDSVRVFDTVYVQTGGANGTETLSLLAYDQLTGRLNLGLGAAVAMLLLLLLAAGTAVAFVLAFRADLRQLAGGGDGRGDGGDPDEWDPDRWAADDGDAAARAGDEEWVR